MKKVLITGANGYIGARLVNHLRENSFEVYGQCLHPSAASWLNQMKEVIVGDIRDESIQDKLCELGVDSVIHLISLDHHKSEDNPSFVTSVNVAPTWSLLKKFSETGLKTFVYFSTIKVYGVLPAINITEDFVCKPDNAYALTHLMSEEVVNYFNRNTSINAINIRLSNSYGTPIFRDNNCWWLVINDMCKTAFLEKRVVVKSNGSPQRDFIHLQDVCKIVEKLLTSEKSDKLDNTFHLSSSKTLTILELAHVVKNVYFEMFEEDIPILMSDGSDISSLEKYMSINRYTIDNSKLKQLGFLPVVNLNHGIKELFAYLKENELPNN